MSQERDILHPVQPRPLLLPGEHGGLNLEDLLPGAVRQHVHALVPDVDVPSYVPAPVERKQVYGITFEQGRNELDVNGDLLSDIVTVNKEIPDAALIDMKIALITLKYTQSNSVCYVKAGQAIGIGAGPLKLNDGTA